MRGHSPYGRPEIGSGGGRRRGAEVSGGEAEEGARGRFGAGCSRTKELRTVRPEPETEKAGDEGPEKRKGRRNATGMHRPVRRRAAEAEGGAGVGWRIENERRGAGGGEPATAVFVKPY